MNTSNPETTYKVELQKQVENLLNVANPVLENLFTRGRDATAILEVVLESRIIDQSLNTCEQISLEAARVLDSTHLSQSIHAVIACDFYNQTLVIPKKPANKLQEIGFFHYTNILGKPWTDRDEGQKIPIKVRVKKFVMRAIFPLLNKTVLMIHRFSRKPLIGYGELYNLEPKLDAKTIFHLAVMSLRQGLVRIDSEVNSYQLPLARQTNQFAIALRQTISEALNLKLSQIPNLSAQYDCDFLSRYIAMSIPITHLEQRSKHYFTATCWAKSLKLDAIASSIGLMTDSSMVFFSAASRVINSTQLIGIQHGGYYGYVRGHNHNFNAEYNVFDSYLTWGWNIKEHHYGPIKAQTRPIGSPYLGKIVKQFPRQSPWHDATVPHPKVLLVSGPFVEAGARCEGQLGGSINRNYLFPVNATAVANFCHHIGACLLHLKGGYPASLEPEYFQQLSQACLTLSVNCQTVPTQGSAMMLLHNYDIVIFDSVGTAFFEAMAIGKSIALLPSAIVAPQRKGALDVDSNLYIHNLLPLPPEKISSTLEVARQKTIPFATAFGSATEKSIFEFLTVDTLIANHFLGSAK
jgi:hypothetical protein